MEPYQALDGVYGPKEKHNGGSAARTPMIVEGEDTHGDEGDWFEDF
jgi:hypothetical protein